MKLRSQPQSMYSPPPQSQSQPRPQSISIRDIMKLHDQSVRVESNKQNNNILPPSLTNPNFQTDELAKNMVGMFAPPSHIQSQTSIEVPIIQNQNRSRTPRRRKIFNDDIKKSNNQGLGIKNIYSLGNTPQFSSTPASPPAPFSPPQSMSPQLPDVQNQRKISQNSIQNNSISAANSSAYNSLPSMKKTNQSVYNTINEYQEPQAKFILDSPNDISMNSKRDKNNSFKSNNSDGINPLVKLNKSNSSNNPVPVYENNFYKNSLNQANDSSLKYNFQSQPTYQPYITNSNKININNPLLNALSNDYRRFQEKASTNDPRITNQNKQSRANSSNKSPSFAYPYGQQHSVNISEPILNNVNHNQYSNFVNNTGSPNQVKPISNYNINNNNVQSFQPENRNQVYALSPFQYSSRQQFLQIPKKFQYIQAKISRQQKQLQQLNQKLSQTQLSELESQKVLLTQLIQKQQQLSQKQRQINNNLDQINRLQNQSNYKKQQMMRYQLQLQQAKRIQNLNKQNQRLIRQIAKGTSTLSHNSYNSNNPVQIVQPIISYQPSAMTNIIPSIIHNPPKLSSFIRPSPISRSLRTQTMGILTEGLTPQSGISLIRNNSPINYIHNENNLIYRQPVLNLHGVNIKQRVRDTGNQLSPFSIDHNLY